MMARIPALLLVMAAGAACLAQAAAGPPPAADGSPASLDATRHYARAKWLLLDGDAKGAIEELNAAHRLDPDSPQILKLLASAQWSAGSRDEAADSWREALRIGGDDIECHYQLGWYHYLRDEFEQARTQFAAIDTDPAAHSALPQYVMSQFYLARCEDRLDNTQQAIARYQKFYELTRDYRSGFRALPELLWLMREPSLIPIYIARAQSKLRQFDQAAATLAEANGRHPTWVLGHVELARVYLLAGQGDKALEVAKAIAGRLPSNREALRLAAEVFRALEQGDQLLEFLKGLVEANPDQQTLLEFYAEALKNAGRDDAARDIYQKLLLLRANSPSALLELAKLQQEKGDLKDALLTLARGLDQGRPDGGLVAIYLRRYITDAGREKTAELNEQVAKDLAAEAAPPVHLRMLAALLAASVDKTADAAALFEACIRQAPANAFAYAALGQMLAAAGKGQEAAAVYRRAIDAGLRDVFFYRATGDLMLAAGDAAKARDAYRDGLEVSPEDADTRLGLAMAYAKAGQYLSAESELQRVLRQQPGNELARLALAEVLLSGLHDSVRATREVQTILASDPHNRDALQLLARARIHDRQYDKALEVLTPLATADPKDWQSRLLIAAVHLTRQADGDLDAAAAQLEAVLVAQPDLLEALSMLVDVRLGQREYPQAAELLERIVKVAPKDDASRRTLAAVRMNLGEHDKAISLLQGLVDANPGKPEYLQDLAVALSRAGRQEESEKALQKVLEIDPRHPGANNNLGYAWADRGVHLKEAERMIRLAVSAAPDVAAYQDSLGWVLYKTGRFTEAAETFDALLKTEGARRDPAIWDHQGDVLWRLGRRKDAAEAWKRSLEVNDERNEHLKQLAKETRSKLDRSQAGQEVTVAPLGEDHDRTQP